MSFHYVNIKKVNLVCVVQTLAPQANTTFSVVYLGRREGPVSAHLYIHTSLGVYKYPVSIQYLYTFQFKTTGSILTKSFGVITNILDQYGSEIGDKLLNFTTPRNSLR